MGSGDRSSVYDRAGRVVLSIYGHYTTKDAERCVPIAIALFREHESCEFVVDLVHMTGFDTESRVLWQENLSELKKRIHTITIVGGSPLARMSGAAVCLYAGIRMRFATNLEEVFMNAPRRNAS